VSNYEMIGRCYALAGHDRKAFAISLGSFWALSKRPKTQSACHYYISHTQLA